MEFTDDSELIKANVKGAFGYYLILYVNNSKDKIRDSNKDTQKKIYGKTVILPYGVSIKHGKYEGGHVARRILDFVHLKKGGDDADGHSQFHDVFVQSYNLKFEGSKKDLRKLESRLNKVVKDFLKEEDETILKENQIVDWTRKSGAVKHRVLGGHPMPETLVDYDFRKNRGDWRQINMCTKDDPNATIEKAQELMKQLKEKLEEN
jgi:hypothetical protein